jgi:GTP-binding protein
MPQFLDHVFIEVSSGDGGNGVIAWRKEKYEPFGGPAGGNGGRGGSVYIEATSDLNTLITFQYKSKFQAAHGQKGSGGSRYGKAAEDLLIKVPIGTVIKDAESGMILADMREPDKKVLIAEGGRGGRGNKEFASSTNRAPYYCEPGEPGIKRLLELELKLLADIGLIGLPNAGKSTLLAAMSAAKPKIAAYPFSTLTPNLGTVKNKNGDGYVMADIPGLMEGASSGIGLGHEFLRHVERTRLLIHVVDISSEQLDKDIETINRELELFDPELAKKEQIIVLNKTDLCSSKDIEDTIKKIRSKYKDASVFPISAAGRVGLENLIPIIDQRLTELRSVKEVAAKFPEKDEKAFAHDRGSFVVSHTDGKFSVASDRIERLIAVTDLKSPESVHHLGNVLRAMGVMDELYKQEIKVGDEVQFGSINFIFGENIF